MVKGIPASNGIAIGKTFVLPTWDWDLPDEEINVNDLAKEFERLHAGIRSSKNEIRSMQKEISDLFGGEGKSIFDAHLAILDDPAFMEEIRGIIQRQYKAAEVAVKEAIDKFANMFDLLDDEYMKERAIDIKDVGNRLIQHLLGAPTITLPTDTQPFILVARELSPSQMAHLNPNHVKGILTMVGGKTSHSAIMARALGIPMIVGLEGKLESPLKTGDFVVMDGEEGTLHVNPPPHIVAEYEVRQKKWTIDQESLRKIVSGPARTRDGYHFHLHVNINSLKELEQIEHETISGIGLFRTEFLYMDRDSMPSEEEQYAVYRKVAEAMRGKPVIIRTLDTGGDKKLDYFDYPHEDNPFLGYRAIRISLDHQEQLKTQMKAIWRAAAHGNVKVMYPMISSVEEVRRANEIMWQAKRELKQENKPCGDKIEVGIMIEVPAAVAIADLLAQEVDFFSIGTNDLVQYVLAVDRMNERIAHMYDPYHPAVLRMLKMTVEAAKRHGINVSVCGELAGDERALTIWLGLGIDHLSMSTQSLLRVKNRILKSDAAWEIERFDRLMHCRTSEEVHRELEAYEHAEIKRD